MKSVRLLVVTDLEATVNERFGQLPDNADALPLSWMVCGGVGVGAGEGAGGAGAGDGAGGAGAGAGAPPAACVTLNFASPTVMLADRAVPPLAATDIPIVALADPFPFEVTESQDASVVAVHAHPVRVVS